MPALRWFFCSSRRRHTRCSRDWSSDVCSSDLDPVGYVGLWLADAAVDPAAQPALAAHWLDWFEETKTEAVGFGLVTLRAGEIGRASCRERAWIPGVGAGVKDKSASHPGGVPSR